MWLIADRFMIRSVTARQHGEHAVRRRMAVSGSKQHPSPGPLHGNDAVSRRFVFFPFPSVDSLLGNNCIGWQRAVTSPKRGRLSWQKFSSPDFKCEEYEVVLMSRAGDNHPNRNERWPPVEEGRIKTQPFTTEWSVLYQNMRGSRKESSRLRLFVRK